MRQVFVWVTIVLCSGLISCVKPKESLVLAGAIGISTQEDESVTGRVPVKSEEGKSYTYSLATEPSKGTIELNAETGEFSYTPNPNENGDDVFEVVVKEDKFESIVSVSVNIEPVNDAPMARAAAIVTNEDTTRSAQLPGTDVDGDKLTYIVDGNPSLGVVNLNPNTGLYIFTPGADMSGLGTFSYRVSDGELTSAPAVVTVSVTPVNDAPTVSNALVSTDEDMPVSGTLMADDIDSVNLTFSIVSGGRGTASVDPATGDYSFMPKADDNGTDTVTFKVSDGDRETEGTVTVTIVAKNDAPVAKNMEFSTDEEMLALETLMASDLESDAFTFVKMSDPEKGTVSFNPANGVIAYTPRKDETGIDTFTYRVTEKNSSLESNVATVTFDIRPVNDGPTAKNGVLLAVEDETKAGMLQADDIDGDSLTYSIVSDPRKGRVTITDAKTGAYSYEPLKNENGSDSFTFKVTDNQLESEANVQITLSAVNDAPVIDLGNGEAPIRPIGQTEESRLTPSGATDVDGDSLGYIVRATNHGSVRQEGNDFIYTAPSDYVGEDSYTYVANDGSLDSNPITVKFEVMRAQSVSPPPTTAAAFISIELRGGAGLAGANIMVGKTAQTDFLDNSIYRSMGSLVDPATDAKAIDPGFGLVFNRQSKILEGMRSVVGPMGVESLVDGIVFAARSADDTTTNPFNPGPWISQVRKGFYYPVVGTSNTASGTASPAPFINKALSEPSRSVVVDTNVGIDMELSSVFPMNSPAALQRAAVAGQVINDLAGVGNISLNGYDYHDGSRTSGDQKDLEAGILIGQLLKYAHLKHKPLVIYVFTDGGMVADPLTGAWVGDRGQTAISFMLVYNPTRRITLDSSRRQIGEFHIAGVINLISSEISQNVSLLTEAVVLNYLRLHGMGNAYATIPGLGNLQDPAKHTPVANEDQLSHLYPLPVKIVPFHIADGTDQSPWNTEESKVVVLPGDVLRIINNDTSGAAHSLQTFSGFPCNMMVQGAIPLGGYFDCAIPADADPDRTLGLYDHYTGPNAKFYVDIARP